MSLRRYAALTLGATALAAGGLWVAHGLAEAAQNRVVVQRFLLGYFDRKGRFVPTAGRNATNVDRNSHILFVFSGAVDSGPNRRATLPLTLAEQAELDALIKEDPDYDPRQDGYEPGAIPRKRSEDRSGYFVATGSVSRSTIEVTVPSGSGSADAKGQFFKYLRPGSAKPMANRLLFNPRYVESVYGQPGQVDYNPESLEPNTLYSVFIDGGPSPADAFNLLRNLSGDSLGASFSTTFQTGNRYAQDFTRPEVRETSPTDTTINVETDADVEVTFNEPMDIASFVTPRFQGDDQWTINVRFAQQSLNNGGFAGRNVLGAVRIKPQTAGNVVQFRPLQGFGKGPYDFEAIVTNGVTDLSGNNIIRQFQFTFQTEYNPEAEEFSTIEEFFDNTSKRDPAFTPSGDYLPALWNAGSNKGVLTTVVNETQFDVGTPNNHVNLWANFAIRLQALFPASEMGGRPRTLSGFSWSNGVTTTGLSYPNTTVQVGHASDLVGSAGFPAGGPQTGNFGDTPVVVSPAATYTPAVAGLPVGSWLRAPGWIKNFNYDGSRSLILDVSHGGNGTASTADRWRINNAYAIQSSTVSLPGPPPTNQTNTWFYNTRFHYLTPGAEAQSLFYDFGRNDARVQPEQLVPVNQPQGTSAVFLWQGAKEDASSPGTIDTSSYSNWVSDIRQLASFRWVRFRATLINDLTNRVAPSVDSVTIPYTYR